jgi:hypothetical protein
MTRITTNRLLEMMDEGLITPTQLAEMALGFMSEDDVKEMARANELLDYEDEDEEEPEGTEGYTGDEDDVNPETCLQFRD